MASSGRRAYWLKTLHLWHWVSAALCLTGMVLLSFTGITLNHAAHIPATPSVVTQDRQLPHDLLTRLPTPDNNSAPLPPDLRTWLAEQLSVKTGTRPAEWSADEVYLALPRPGGDAWLSVDLQTGAVRHEDTDRGWIAYLNDLHKGRNTGLAWTIFLDVLAVACLVFSITGLLLLKLHASQRPSTWPTVGFGLLLPLLLALLFIH